jgi:hypothetical protein
MLQCLIAGALAQRYRIDEARVMKALFAESRAAPPGSRSFGPRLEA